MRGRRRGLLLTGLMTGAVVLAAGIVIAPLDLLTNPYLVHNLAFVVTGAVLAWNRPSHVLGWLFTAIGLIGLIGLAAGALGSAPSLPPAVRDWASVVSASAVTVGTALIPLAVILFPDGHPPSRRWRPVIAVNVGVVVVGGLAAFSNGGFMGLVDEAAISPFPDAVVRAGQAVSMIAFGLPLLLVAACASLAVRWRRSHGEERQQLKVLLAAVAMVLIAAVAMPFIPVVGIGASDVLTAIGLTGVPVAAAIAILRYRLWDFDLVLSRTVVVVVLAGLVTVVYAAVVVGFGRLLERGTDDLLLQVVATSLVALAFAPVRSAATRLSHRLVYGRRATPFEVLSEVSERIGATVADRDLLDRTAELLAAATGASTATVWLVRGELFEAAGAWPAARERPAPVPRAALREHPAAEVLAEVLDGGDVVGALTLTTPRAEGLTPTERHVLDDLAASAALALRRIALDADLAARVEELRASRRRLVAAQDAARRKLERDLHDGAQQHLVALKVRLGLAKTLAAREGAEGLVVPLEQLAEQTDAAVVELRAIAHGIYPPLLAAEGLPAALTALARRQPFAVEVRSGDVGRHPEDLEATSYFAAVTVLEQSARAGVREATIEADAVEGGLRLRIVAGTDDLDLTGVEDRVDAAAGVVTAGDGQVVITLPPQPAAQELR